MSAVEVESLKCMLSHEREARLKLVDLVTDLQIENNRLKRQLGENQKHGRSGYSAGCRCGVCCDAAREYQMQYRNLKKNISK